MTRPRDQQATLPQTPTPQLESQAPREAVGLGVKRRLDDAPAYSSNAGEPTYKKARNDSEDQFQAAIQRADLGAVRALLQSSGSALAWSGGKGKNLLMSAVEANCADMVSAISQAMPPCDQTWFEHVQAFLYAAIVDRPEVLVRMLALAPALKQSVNRQGQSALHLASMHGNQAALAALLHSPADLSLRDLDGNTPLIQAAMSDQPGAIALLRGAGASLEEVNNAGLNATAAALDRNSLAALECLMARGDTVLTAPDGFFNVKRPALSLDVARGHNLPPEVYSPARQTACKFAQPRAWFVRFSQASTSVKAARSFLKDEGMLFVVCEALSRELACVSALKPALLGATPTPTQVAHLMAGLVGLQGMRVSQSDEDAIQLSRLSDSSKSHFLERRAWELHSFRVAAEAVWSHSLAALANRLEDKVVGHITPGGELLKEELICTLMEKYGLFEPVAQLLVHCVELALAEGEDEVIETRPEQTLGDLFNANGASYRKFSASLRKLLQNCEHDDYASGYRASLQKAVLRAGEGRTDYGPTCTDLVFAQWKEVLRVLAA